LVAGTRMMQNTPRKVTLTNSARQGQEPGNTKYKHSSDQSVLPMINWIMLCFQSMNW